jgi:hypothetical protein
MTHFPMPPVIKAQRVIAGDAAAREEPKAPLPGRAKAHSRAEKKVRLVHVDGVPTAIEFTCACGEVSVIELELPESPGREDRT